MFLLEFQFLVISLDHWRRGVTLTLLTSHSQPNVLRFGDAWGVKVGKRGKGYQSPETTVMIVTQSSILYPGNLNSMHARYRQGRVGIWLMSCCCFFHFFRNCDWVCCPNVHHTSAPFTEGNILPLHTHSNALHHHRKASGVMMTSLEPPSKH